MRIRFPALFFAAAAIALGACGGGGSEETDAAAPATGLAASPDAPAAAPPPPPAVPRRVEIEMVDVAFKPTAIDVKRGETVAFVFTNRGEAKHNAFLGDAKAQEDHEKEVQKAMAAGGTHNHAAHGGGIVVGPGQTGALRKTFTEPGTLEIGCHEPGHYVTGMKLTINVT